MKKKGKKRKEKERKEKERKGKERKGKKRKGFRTNLTSKTQTCISGVPYSNYSYDL